MNKHPIKRYSTLGCCGLDCGLCPRYYTFGSSRCPGCCGADFFNKHPSCSYITCCVKKKSLEVCAECDEFPCSKFKPLLESGVAYDSFLTYEKVQYNLDFIKKYGIDKFIKQQDERIKFIEKMLENFNDGRSKSFFCIATTLLSIEDLKIALDKTKQKIKEDKIGLKDVKTKAKILKKFLNEFAVKEGIELRLRKKYLK